ncbi:antibiotic biosynthesis monooxygenase [Rhodobacteraceae bacterium RKSG542]|uniref:antibiotic biosynthesis monooxygenase family protein n=1 Tax=Pseudovibrio flavus TaxID=2529854 RepID=UPI0012BC252F|nr:antibiotic biosynthesis monooxygenase [Pseudovibrio flavus]MTI16839.1 antibiotic biosynthesis monooxygenase [Pseudovibrio flavus]
MHVVIFEVYPTVVGKPEYLQIAASLRKELEQVDGCISIERFESLTNQGKILSLSFWESEAAIAEWKANLKHHLAQSKGRDSLFQSYRIRVAEVQRDYDFSASENA